MVRIATSRLSGHPGVRIASPASRRVAANVRDKPAARLPWPLVHGGSCVRRRSKPPRSVARAREFSSTYASRTGSHGCLRPGGLDPVRSRGRLVMGRTRLWPAERCRDVADRNGDDPIRIPAGKLVLWKVLAEPGDRVLVGLVVGPHVEIARRGIHAEALELADDRLVLGPPANQLVGSIDGGFEEVERDVRSFRLEIRVLLPPLVVALHKALVQRPAVAARIGEVIVGMHTGQHTLRVILADR